MAVLIGLLLADSTKATAVASTAYVAFLCNEAMLLPILVLIRSLKVNQGRTKSDICIMVTDGVPKKGRQAIQAEGAKIIDAPETPYPYEVTEKRKKMAKQCRFVNCCTLDSFSGYSYFQLVPSVARVCYALDLVTR